MTQEQYDNLSSLITFLWMLSCWAQILFFLLIIKAIKNK